MSRIPTSSATPPIPRVSYRSLGLAGPLLALLAAAAVAAAVPPGPTAPAAPLPELACPKGAELEVQRGYDEDDAARLWLTCHRRGEDGLYVRHGPRHTYAVENETGEPTYRLIESFAYRAGEAHGVHRRWSGSGRLVLEETLVDDRRHGESRSWYASGGLRELRHFRYGRLHGERRAWYPTGEERWSVDYEHGRPVSFAGERRVAGEPCPEGTLPTASADGREEVCRRDAEVPGERHGPYVVWAEDGAILERGLYRDGQKAEVWAAPPSAPASPHELAGVPVAEAWLTAGGREITAYTDDEPDAGFRNVETNARVSPELDYAESKLRIAGLAPGSYEMSLCVNANPANPERYPGDLCGSFPFEVVVGEVSRFEAELQRVLHVTEPIDNGAPIRELALPCDEQRPLSAPIRFAWKPPAPPAPDVVYHYRVRRIQCALSTYEEVTRGSTRETSIELDLPPSRPGESYAFDLGAATDGEPIAFIIGHAPGVQTWDIRFRVAGD